jgi:hypothetical protein
MVNLDHKKNRVTASGFLDHLRDDSKHLARLREADEQCRRLVERQGLASMSIIDELNKAGFQIETLDELRRSGRPYSAAIPILIKWLPIISDTRVKESIIRTLSVPWARPSAAPALITEFLAAPASETAGLKWAIANALDVIADDAVFGQISELVQDKRNGKAREMLAKSLGNMSNPLAVPLLLDLLKEEDIAGHVIIALGKLRASEASPHIQKFLKHRIPWIRKEAKKALDLLKNARRQMS